MTLADPLRLDGASLTVTDLLAVAEEGRPVSLAAEARARMQSTRDVVEGIAARGESTA